MIGQTISHYKVTAKLGEGGMGVVYRATDSKLGRDVALKVLPENFAADGERMARFEREAQLLAALNHAHIAGIYGLEEYAGPEGSGRALAMELVEGPTLADRIAQGPIPLEEALPIALQIAEALEYAHDRGIVHRDLKPANIKLTADGKVKVLDFGLAKALDDPVSSMDVATSPTITAAATRAGIILGTAAYMSPEQAKGKPADRRADIWAFGVVLYEMLSGKQLYTGETVSETLAHVILNEPRLDVLPAATPPRVRRLIARCLTREPKQRLQAIGEARIALDEALAGVEEIVAVAAAPAALPAPPPWRRALPWAAAGFSLLAFALALWRPWDSAPAPRSVVRLSVELGSDASLVPGTLGSGAVISPDGKRLAFVGRTPNQQPQLFIRPLNQLKATPLAGTEGVHGPFFSPDNEWIAFFAGGKLKKISVQGGAVVTLCDAAGDRGGSWGDDDRIVFAAGNREGLSRVPSAGGKPEPLTELDKATNEITHRWPQVLPGSKAVLFTTHNAGSAFDNATIVVQSLETKERKIVQRGGSYARYLRSGHLMYMHEGTLFAAAFDLDRLELAGQPAPAVEEVITTSGTGSAQFAVSETGLLLYAPGRGTGGGWPILWMDKEGKTTPLRTDLAVHLNPRFSPDGTQLAVDVPDSNNFNRDVWIYDWRRDALTRFTFSDVLDADPVWTPDGRRIVFRSEQGGTPANLYWKRSDGAGDVQRLTESKNAQVPGAWRPDGKTLAFFEQRPDTRWDIMILPMEGDEKSGWKPGKPTVFLSTPFLEVTPAFSPDGRWLAYGSNESGRFEVYVRPYPGPGGVKQVSIDGGGHPTWSPNGKEIFFRTPDHKIMVATYSAAGEAFRVDKPLLWAPAELTDLGTNRNFALHPDGKRFAVLKSSESQSEVRRDKITVIENFFDELRRIAPQSKK
jgi:serine/threonine-protein kinase